MATEYPSTFAGGPQPVRVYLPPCYDETGAPYPVLFLLAGNIHDESKWDELGLDEAATELIASGEIPPLVVVMPDGGWMANNTSGGPGSYESVILEDLLPWVEKAYCVRRDAAGRAIGGLSRGGYWALEIAFRHPERFASVGGHSAALLDTHAGPTINPRQTALTQDLGALRVYLDIGADDYLRANTIELHEKMAAGGVPHTWILQEGRHEDAYWAENIETYLRWYAEPWAGALEESSGCDASHS
ncbi:MAG: alpha/beta hydrolase-fold protein [Candidatus Promineifilaceae bacterium]|nr:alpha/beta hydrolase-fold protein [Candidatus Promineifilaceae bacterium]